MTIIYILIGLTCLEHLYSVYRRDEFCSVKTTIVNMLNQLFGVVKDHLIPILSVIGIVRFADKVLPHLFHFEHTIPGIAVCLVMMDFLYYCSHRVSHSFVVPWMFHFVHHSSHRYNVSAGFRSSFLEVAVLFAFNSMVLVLGFPLETFLFAFKITSTYQFVTHSRYLKFPRFVEYVFVTPSYHMTHHDQDRKNQNSNFGGVFTFWDRIFRTHAETPSEETFLPGIKGYAQDNLIRIHIDPIFIVGKQALARRAKRRQLKSLPPAEAAHGPTPPLRAID